MDSINAGVLSPQQKGMLGRSPSVSPREFGMMRSPSKESLQHIALNRNQNSYTTLPATHDPGDRGMMKHSGSVSYLSPVITAARQEVNTLGNGDAHTEMMGDRKYTLSVADGQFMANSEI